MMFGDLKIEKELNDGAEYLVWLTERSTKTRTDELAMGHQRLFNPKAYATGDERCAVKLYRSFISHRPKTMCEDSSPLFLAVRHGIEYKNNVIWYHAKPLGVNSIGQFMSTLLNLNNKRCKVIIDDSDTE